METHNLPKGSFSRHFPVLPKRKHSKRNFSWIPFPLLCPIFLLVSLWASIAQAQPAKELLLEEDFNWSDNAWNSSKAAESPYPGLSFQGNVYRARRSIKMASSSHSGELRQQIGIESVSGSIELVFRGARYDSVKPSLLPCLLLVQGDTLLDDTLHFSSFYKNKDSEPFRQYDSMTQDEGFASCDTLRWVNPDRIPISSLELVVTALAGDQNFLDHFQVFLLQEENGNDDDDDDGNPAVHVQPDSLLFFGETGSEQQDSLWLEGRNLYQNIRLQITGPDQNIQVFPVLIQASDLQGQRIPVQVQSRIPSIPTSYFLHLYHGENLLKEIPVHARPGSQPEPLPEDTSCQAPASAMVSEVASYHADLQWESSAPLFHLRVGNLFSIIHEEITTSTSVRIPDLEPGMLYWWEVASICNNADTSLYTVGESFVTLQESGIRLRHDESTGPAASVHPNPSKSGFILHLPFRCQVRILNLDGKCVFSKKLEKGPHPIRLREKGVFILRYGNHEASAQNLKIILL